MNMHDIPPSVMASRLDAEAFLNGLAPGETEFTFQTFDETKHERRYNLARVLHGTLDEHWQTLCNLSSRGAGVFVAVNRTDLKGRSNKNIISVRAVFVDIDNDDADYERFELEASFGVASSPGKIHLYWSVNASPMGRMVAEVRKVRPG